MAIQFLDQVWTAEDRARLWMVRQQVGSWVGSRASGAWWAGEGMASRPSAFCCRVLGSKPPRLGAVPQPGGGLGESSAAPQRRTPPALSRWAQWTRALLGQEQQEQEADGASLVRAPPSPCWEREFLPTPRWESECSHRVHTGRESVPAESMPGERAFTLSPPWTEKVPSASMSGEHTAFVLHVEALTSHPSRPGQVGRGAIAGPGPVLNGWTDRFPARESEPLTPGWGWGRRVELLRLYSLP